MEFIVSAVLVLLVISPLFVLYRRKVQGKSVKTGLIVNVVSAMALCLIVTGLGIGQTAGAADAAQAAAGAMSVGAGLGLLAAALSTSVACVGGGIAVAAAASAALGAISENDKAFGKALIFVGMAEGIPLYGVLISFQILSKIV
ncbi:ATP synthase subunit C [Oscillospiraceae bacterium OttesenSCG-928-F05]|nr:ATP synthase subunit C [Oscillospiraceae bacterium OttesenSCG-928-F05]